MAVTAEYDYRNCQSLFGYSAEVHRRSGGVCQLCGAGQGNLDFDFWRQLTVEHLIGQGQGGYLNQIRDQLTERFPDMDPAGLRQLAGRIDAANTVSACQFCNSTTSRTVAPVSMTAAIMQAPDGTEDKIFEWVTRDLAVALESKRETVRWKLASVRRAFEELIAPDLLAMRRAETGPLDGGHG
jgi:hypothetical protein